MDATFSRGKLKVDCHVSNGMVNPQPLKVNGFKNGSGKYPHPSFVCLECEQTNSSLSVYMNVNQAVNLIASLKKAIRETE